MEFVSASWDRHQDYDTVFPNFFKKILFMYFFREQEVGERNVN